MSIVLFIRFDCASTVSKEKIFSKKIVCTMPKETRRILGNKFKTETEVFNEPNLKKNEPDVFAK